MMEGRDQGGWEGKKERGKGKEGKEEKEREGDGPHFCIQVYPLSRNNIEMTSSYQQHQMLSSEIINICHLKQLDIDIKSGIAAEWQEMIILLLHMCYNNFFIAQIYSLQEVLILTYLTLVLSLDGEVRP
jgi:hypothetical protein